MHRRYLCNQLRQLTRCSPSPATGIALVTTSIGVFEPNTGNWHFDNGNGIWDDCGSGGDSCVTTNNHPGSLPVVKEMSSEKLVLGTFNPQVTTQVNGEKRYQEGSLEF